MCAEQRSHHLGRSSRGSQITFRALSSNAVANQQTGLAINFNLGNVLTVSASQPQVVTAVNLAATNVLSANALPRQPTA